MIHEAIITEVIGVLVLGSCIMHMDAHYVKSAKGIKNNALLCKYLNHEDIEITGKIYACLPSKSI